MASGRLGNGTITAQLWTQCYDVPAGKIASFSIFLVNRGGDTAYISIAISTSGVIPAEGEYIENNLVIGDGVVYERTGLVASADEYVLIYATRSGINYRIQGYEETP